MIRFYADENVERPIIRGLRQRGVEILTAEEDGYGRTDDSLLLDRATVLNCVVFSRDRDFLQEATRRQIAGRSFPGVVYAHKRDVSIGQCVKDLELLAFAGAPADFENGVYFLPL